MDNSIINVKNIAQKMKPWREMCKKAEKKP